MNESLGIMIFLYSCISIIVFGAMYRKRKGKHFTNILISLFWFICFLFYFGYDTLKLYSDSENEKETDVVYKVAELNDSKNILKIKGE